MFDLPRHADGVAVSLAELLALQEQHKLVKLATKSRKNAMLAGNRLTHIKGRGMEFSEVRAYQAGDDVRTIDWRITARTGKAHTKLFSEERERPILFCVDFGSRLRVGSQWLLQSVQAAHLSALLGWHLMEHGDRLGALISSESSMQEHKPKGRRGGLLTLLNALVNVHAAPVDTSNPNYWQDTLTHLHRLAKPGTLIVVISNALGFNPTAVRQLAQLKRHCEVRAFCISDPLFEQGQLPAQLAVQLQGEQSQDLWLNQGQQKQWRAHWQRLQHDSQNALLQHQIMASTLSAAEPLDQQWQKLWL